MEYLDVLDSRGKMTGQKLPRTDVHSNGSWHKAIHCWLINNKNELLLQKRTLNKETNPGMWDISVAGHMPAGSTPIETVIKEAQEELGLELSPKDIEHLFTIKQQSIHQDGQYLNNEIDEVFLVSCNKQLNDFTLQADEVAAVTWLPLDELQRLIDEKNPTFVAHQEYKKLFTILNKKS